LLAKTLRISGFGPRIKLFTIALAEAQKVPTLKDARVGLNFKSIKG
jgi:hypothetical protein